MNQNVLNILAAPAFLLAGMLIALYVKDRAQKISEDEFSKNIKSALAVFKGDLIDSLDEIYIRRGECSLMMDAQSDRIDVDSLRISKVETRFDDFKNTLHNSRNRKES